MWLKATGVEEQEADDFAQALRKLGQEHEAHHLTSDLGDHLNLGDCKDLEEQSAKTLEAVARGESVIYQGAFRVETELGGEIVEIVGLPDFLIRGDGGYTVRDAKLARTIDDKRLDIVHQLQIYGWLFEQATGAPPLGLEVYNGKREITSLAYDGGAAALAELEQILKTQMAADEPPETVGWTKCQKCGFGGRCWPEAEAAREPGIVPAIDVGMGDALRELGVATYDEVAERFDQRSLSDLKRPRGEKMVRFGDSAAEKALAQIEALQTNAPVMLGELVLPSDDHFVMFDLEGLPPDADGPEVVYLWGLQVYHRDGSEPDQFMPGFAGFGDEGDKEGWHQFLANARAILDQYGEDIRFVHWSHYEPTKMRLYIEKFGDPDGLAVQLIDKNLLDLLPVTRDAVALPIPSYSLKVLEAYVGYERTKVPGFKGDKSIARYMEAVESEDEDLREQIKKELSDYNNEDLEATWAVMDWLFELRDGRV